MRALYTSETIYWANFLSGFFTAGIFLPDLIILANLLSGVFTAAGITEPPPTPTSAAVVTGAIARTYFPCCVVVPERARRTFQTCDISDAFLSNIHATSFEMKGCEAYKFA